MSDQTPGAGWFPDPENNDQLRYWDGKAWTEHRAPKQPAAAGPTLSPAPPTGQPWTGQSAPAGTRPKKHTGLKIVGAVFAVFVILGIIGAITGGGDTTQNTSSGSGTSNDTAAAPSSPTATSKAPKPKPASPYGNQPKDEVEFLAATKAAQDAESNADNDLQRGAALSKRNKAICSTIGSGNVTNWVGKVSEIDANGDGKGILGVELGSDIHVSTWNNFLSDTGDHTLIEPNDPLFGKVLALHTGDLVTFSGRLLPDIGGDPCVNDSRMTLWGKLSDPEYIFRFSDVRRQ